MRSALFVAVATTGLSASAFAGSVPTNFGTLTDYWGNEISFDAGTGNSNTNFMYQHFNGSYSAYTFGLSAQTYYGSANGPVTNNGDDTFYVQAGADQSGNPSAGAGAGRWSFKWSITDDLNSGVPNVLKMALRIDGPSGGSWGSIDSAYAAPLTAYPGSGTEYANQQVWGTYYDFMQLDSASSGAPAGVWDGLAYDYDEVGTYTITMTVFEDVGGGVQELATMTMNIEVQGSTVVPGVGGIAALGGLGLLGRRRRR